MFLITTVQQQYGVYEVSTNLVRSEYEVSTELYGAVQCCIVTVLCTELYEPRTNQERTKYEPGTNQEWTKYEPSTNQVRTYYGAVQIVSILLQFFNNNAELYGKAVWGGFYVD